jgi:hypothetical protein
MTIRQNLVFALVGWVVGLCCILGIALIVFPVFFGISKTIATLPDLLAFLLVVILVSPATMLGGLIGGRALKEGGRTGQMIMAAVVGVIAAVPLSCVAFYYTGW